MTNENASAASGAAGTAAATGGGGTGNPDPEDEDSWTEANRTSTGRTEPRSREEKLAMDQVRSDPSKGKVIADKIGDPRYGDG